MTYSTATRARLCSHPCWALDWLRPGSRCSPPCRSAWAAALLGLFWFLAIGGWKAVVPVVGNWMAAGDWPAHWMGWVFFREVPWQLPLGALPNLVYPLGTTVGYTDSIPWLAILFK